jgi:putative glutamine amidotransferase
MAERLGITMRVATAEHGEVRDCLARDWAELLLRLAPEVAWVPLPNVGSGVVDLVRQLGLDGFILSGGNDLRAAPQRDATEAALIDHAVAESLPVFGVCRGLQVLNWHGGGAQQRCARETHVAHDHVVDIRSELLDFAAPQSATVNSYHEWAVPRGQLAPSLELVAASADGCVEAVQHRSAPILAVQWHPERAATTEQAELDRNLMCRTFGWKS